MAYGIMCFHTSGLQCRLPLFLCRNYIKELAICVQSDQPTPETMNVIKNLGECMGRVTAQVIFQVTVCKYISEKAAGEHVKDKFNI